jgi:hypothetical protein
MSGGGIQRRIAARQLALAALLPMAALVLPQLTAQASRRSVPIPAGTFRLERVLSRGLAGGAEIVVTRRWHIAFAVRDRGLTVSGSQVFAEVAAPASLAPLAGAERSRMAQLFPLALDDSGLIQGTEAATPDSLAPALDPGRALIAALPLSAAGRQDAHAFMAELARLGAAAVSRLPRDLFFPRPGRDARTEAIALPGGAAGSIAVTTSASAAPGTGLLVSSERRIVTAIEGTERHTAERWTLADAG